MLVCYDNKIYCEILRVYRNVTVPSEAIPWERKDIGYIQICRYRYRSAFLFLASRCFIWLKLGYWLGCCFGVQLNDEPFVTSNSFVYYFEIVKICRSEPFISFLCFLSFIVFPFLSRFLKKGNSFNIIFLNFSRKRHERQHETSLKWCWVGLLLKIKKIDDDNFETLKCDLPYFLNYFYYSFTYSRLHVMN